MVAGIIHGQQVVTVTSPKGPEELTAEGFLLRLERGGVLALNHPEGGRSRLTVGDPLDLVGRTSFENLLECWVSEYIKAGCLGDDRGGGGSQERDE